MVAVILQIRELLPCGGQPAHDRPLRNVKDLGRFAIGHALPVYQEHGLSLPLRQSLYLPQHLTGQ